MQSFTFNELTRRAKDFAIARYSEEQAVEEMAHEVVAEVGKFSDATIDHVFFCLNWRYTEHGERVG